MRAEQDVIDAEGEARKDEYAVRHHALCIQSAISEKILRAD